MSFDTENLAERLDSLFTEQAPPSAIDAGRAAAAGRATLRRRRGLAAVAVAATTALAGTLVATVPSGHSGSTPATGHSGATAVAGTSAPALPPGTDPLVVPGNFGWLPANAQNIEYTFAPGQQVSTVAKGSGEPGPQTAMFQLTTYAAGTTPSLGTFATGAKQLRVDASPVNGHTAYWITANAADPTNGGDTYLNWQTPSGQWAQLHGYYLGGDPIESTMLHVAAGVESGDVKVPLPIAISGLPAAAVANEIDADRPASTNTAWQTKLIFAVGGSYVDITVRPAGGTAATANGASGGTCDPNRNGLAICVSSTRPVPGGLLPGGLPGLLKSITSLGPDPKNWTTSVVSGK